MKIIIATDKFKGSQTSMEAGESIRSGLAQSEPNAAIEIFPMADGGDGFGKVMKYYLVTQTVHCQTVDPLLREITASWEWDAENKTAVIELASAAGLELLKADERNPLHTSTFGAGLLIQDALKKGAEKIILGLGGSATNDAGMGILAAMDFIFKDERGNVLLPIGKSLHQIKTIEIPSRLRSVQFTVACDVTNILYGLEGAAFVYAPQKGADENEVKILDKGLRNIAALILSQTRKDISAFPGSGAAGGVAAGLAAFFDIKVISGASIVMHASQMDKHLQDTAIIITGEGRLDHQSANGKVVQQVAALGNRNQVPVVAVCGENTLDEKEFTALGLTAVYSLVDEKNNSAGALANAGAQLSALAALIAKEHCKNK